MRRTHPVRTILFCVSVFLTMLSTTLHAPTLAAGNRVSRAGAGQAPFMSRIAPPADVALRWAADDADIAKGAATRTWTWGPQIFRGSAEAYAEAPNQQRAVWYLDKARMEITDPGADRDSAWFVTTGLLVRELISGQLQTGNASYESRLPADVPIAGDLDTPPNQAITYVDLQPLASINNDKPVPSRTEFDAVVAEMLGKGGVVRQEERLIQYDVHLRDYDDVIGHNIAHVFTEAVPADKLLYIAGRPLIEPYWISVSVNHTPTDVLIQAFERRIMTYTPTNPRDWQVEWGNVGRQYAQWRYGNADDGSLIDPSTVLDAPPAIHKLEELSPEAARIVETRKGEIGAAVLDMQTGDIYSIGGARSFPMYSTAKVPIMVGVLNMVQHEQRQITDWEDRLMRVMIRNSDNEAATTLIIHIGGAAPLNRYLRAIGLHNTTMKEYAWGDSRTTPQDMTRLMSKLGHCTILNDKLCHYALELMRGVTPAQRWGIGAGVPGSASVAVKNGWYPERRGWAINSIGYVKEPRKRYAIAVYTRSNPGMKYGIDTIEGIAANVYPAVR